jgi:hypothetical protein
MIASGLPGRVIEALHKGNVELIQILFDCDFLKPTDYFDLTGNCMHDSPDAVSMLHIVARRPCPDFKYLIELLEQYGFRLSSPIETVKPLGDFGSLYKKMRLTDTKITMTEEESQISFLNNYFIFRKFQNVDTEKVHQFYTQDKELPTQSIGIPVRLNKKIVLKDK